MQVYKKNLVAELRRMRSFLKNHDRDVSDFSIYSNFENLELQFWLTFSRRKQIACAFEFSSVKDRDELLDVKFKPLQPSLPKNMDTERLANNVERVERKAKDYFLEVEPAEDWGEFVNIITSRLAQGSAEDLELWAFDKNIKSKKRGRGYIDHIVPIIVAVAYCFDAKKALSESDLSRAWYCIRSGEEFVRRDFLIKNPYRKFQERARSGGIAKANLLVPAKNRVMELLRILAPVVGWKSKAEAVRKLNDPVWEFILTLSKDGEKPALNSDNFEQTLSRWLTKDAPIREIYEKYKKTAAFEKTAENR